MAAEYSANSLQTVLPAQSVIFTEAPVPCNRGMIYHRDESGLFRLASPALMSGGTNGFYVQSCGCCGTPNALYQTAFHCNISVPTGGTVEEISIAIAIDGEIDPSSTMVFTPTAVDVGGNVGAEIIVAVPWICRCSTVSVRNTSTQAIQVENANIVFNFAGIRRFGRE